MAYPSIRSLEMFAAVVETGSFKAASERLDVAPSTISKAIGELESRIGSRLLARTTRQITLTGAGDAYHASVVSALTSLEEGAETVNTYQAAPRGVLRLGVPVAAGQVYIAPLLPKFLRRYPNIHIDLTASDNLLDVVGDAYDLVIRGASVLRDSGLIARKLMDTPAVVCASPDYINAQGAPEAPAELSAHACLPHAQSHLPGEWNFSIDGRDHRIRVDGPLRSSSLMIVRRGALEGLGIARLPYQIVATDIAEGRLVRLLEPYEMSDQAVYLLYPAQRKLALKTRVFIDFLVAELG